MTRIDGSAKGAARHGYPLCHSATVARGGSTARDYLAEHQAFSISIITKYEILRGLKAKGATAQAQAFGRFCETCLILPLTDEIVVKAAEIYATLKKRGEPTGDADILIGASALTHGFGVVTNNEAHFRRIDGLHVDNWLRP